MWSVYVLYNLNDKNKKFYVGLTNNIATRIGRHKSGKVYSTKEDAVSWRLVYIETFLSKADAAKREHNLKYHGQAFRQLKDRIIESIKMAK